MAIKKGICKNFDNCDLADNKEIQEVESTEFFCAECHKPLEEISGGKPKRPDDGRIKKLIILIAAALVVIGGIVATVITIDNKNEEKRQQRIADSIREADSIHVADSIVAAKAKKSAVVNLGYATYNGDSQNGKPHGNGTMTFRRYYVIPGTVDCEAAPNETVTGMWREGKINMGTWYRNDGNQVVVKLGQRYNR